MVVWSIMATCGRHRSLERAVRVYLEQDYEGEHNLVIHNNSDIDLVLDSSIINKNIYLWNNHIDSKTSKQYTNLGAIYTDTFDNIEEDEEYIINFMDDDDLFLPNHLSEGVKGYLKAKEMGMEAYKPLFSYYRHHGGIEKMNNTLEPSMFLSSNWIKNYGFRLTTGDQHLEWVEPLVYGNKIFVDPDGPSTLIYNWGDDYPAWKTSGDGKNPENFNNYRKHSQDHGDKVISPSKKEDYYKLIKDIWNKN